MEEEKRREILRVMDLWLDRHPKPDEKGNFFGEIGYSPRELVEEFRADEAGEKLVSRMLENFLVINSLESLVGLFEKSAALMSKS